MSRAVARHWERANGYLQQQRLPAARFELDALRAADDTTLARCVDFAHWFGDHAAALAGLDHLLLHHPAGGRVRRHGCTAVQRQRPNRSVS